jgi:hypothetical protein
VFRVYDNIAVHWNHTRGKRKVCSDTCYLSGAVTVSVYVGLYYCCRGDFGSDCVLSRESCHEIPEMPAHSRT